ncbi:MAG TPA: hypothetical protein PKA64_20715, partial [Myxococcota bacterium]|nr:hypothetical protein [Myxococcota bacterium]
MASGTTNTLLLIEASALAVVALTALLAPATLMLHIAGIDAHGVAVEPARWAAGPLAAQAALDLWLVVGGLATLPRTLHL